VLCDRETERVRRFADDPSFADKFNPRDVYSTVDEICHADVDAIALFTQPWLHAPQAVQLMESGKHVYSAVPIVSLPDGNEILDWCDRLIQTCRRTGMNYMLGETTFYRASTMFCRRKAAEGAFGDFVYAEGEYCPRFRFARLQPERCVSPPHGQRGRAGMACDAAKLSRAWCAGRPDALSDAFDLRPDFVMKAHAVKVCGLAFRHRAGDEFFDDDAFSNETALYEMSNGSTMRICEHREIGRPKQKRFASSARRPATKTAAGPTKRATIR
jgi:hypothetical protein